MFVDENGVPVGDAVQNSDAATFSNLDPNTSDADAMGGSSTRTIWGTNISLQDTIAKFKDFLLGYQKKYRMWADGASEEETSDPASGGNEREYVTMLNNMLHLGVTGLNLDVRNLKAYPPTVKLWHQLQAYPHEVIPIMDQTIKDLMVDQAEKEMAKLRAEQRQNPQGRSRVRQASSMPAIPSSEINGHSDDPNHQDQIPDLVQEVETRVYKVKPFGLDNSINMRDLNPNGEVHFLF
jgi:DNA replication licensing factor MCM4